MLGGVRWAAAAFVVVSLVAPAPAGAVTVQAFSGPRYSSSGIAVNGGPGADDVSVAYGRERVIVRSGAPDVAAEAPCVVVDPYTARCPSFGAGILVYGEAGDDRLVVRTPGFAGGISTTGGASGYVDGGAGDDRLVVGGDNSVVRGGDGADVLRGGRGGQIFIGDRSTPSDDVIDGGPGRFDVLSYARRREGVRVDLARGVAGRRGERDVLRRIESITGGMGDDVLLGDGRRNVIEDGGGADTIRGRGGDDVVDVRGGNDDARAGAGADLVYAYFNDALAAPLRCGRGDDLAVANGRVVLAGCERWSAEFEPIERFSFVRLPTAARPASVSCTDSVFFRCRGTVRFSAGGRVLATGRFAGRRTRRIPLSPAITAAPLAGHRRVTVALRMRQSGISVTTEAVRARVVLAHPSRISARSAGNGIPTRRSSAVSLSARSWWRTLARMNSSSPSCGASRSRTRAWTARWPMSASLIGAPVTPSAPWRETNPIALEACSKSSPPSRRTE
jgi:hypothetical protein